MPKKETTKQNNDTLANIESKNVDGYMLKFYKILDYKDGGFMQLYDQLINFPELSLTDRLVYTALRHYSKMATGKKDETTFYTNVTNGVIATRLGIGDSTVSNSITHLQSLGIIKLHKSKTRNQRIIEVIRDFSQKQPEQELYEAQKKNEEIPWFEKSNKEERQALLPITHVEEFQKGFRTYVDGVSQMENILTNSITKEAPDINQCKRVLKYCKGFIQASEKYDYPIDAVERIEATRDIIKQFEDLVAANPDSDEKTCVH